MVLRKKDGSDGWVRTSDPLINSQLLYLLSYIGMGVLGASTEGVREALRSGGQHALLAMESGGAEGVRTPDLLHAMQALSQLSYSPRCTA